MDSDYRDVMHAPVGGGVREERLEGRMSVGRRC